MELGFFAVQSISVWLAIILLIVALSLLIALFPTLLLSRFKVVTILKGEAGSLFPRKKTFSLQSSFVIFQFIIAITLIASAIIIKSQLNYIQKKDLGLLKEQVLVVPIDESMQQNYEAIKNSLSGISGVSKVSALSNFPWVKGFYDFKTLVQNEGKLMESNAYTLLVDHDFIGTMGMKMTTGRAFSKGHGKDAAEAFIINETAAKKFGISSVENVKVIMKDVDSGKPKEGELIGIVKDFHLQSLHQPVEPLILTISPEPYYIDNMVLQLSSGNMAVTLKNIESEIKKVAPGRPFEYFFLDEAFDQLYKKELRLGLLFNYFSILAIIISCLGLFGISAFSGMQRAKEIGIRKVLGASVQGLVTLLSRDFLRLVIIASVIAFPVAWWAMNNWLKDFAYRITIGWWVFAVAGIMALLIAFATVSFQAIKAAMVNPVKNLRTE
jgi:putative ABC transport system permease protein